MTETTLPITRCMIRKCTEDAVLLEGTLPICSYHLTGIPTDDQVTMIDVLVTLMMSDSVEDLQAAIDMIIEIVGLVPLEGTYAGGWSEQDLFRFGLDKAATEVSDAQDL